MQFKGREFKGTLTNESLGKQFKSQFDMVNYAIRLAENMIKTGRESTVHSESQNTAMVVVAEIADGKDHLEDIFLEQQGFDDKGLNLNHIEEEVIEEKIEAPTKKAKASKAKKS